jgi:hypothetical protein
MRNVIGDGYIDLRHKTVLTRLLHKRGHRDYQTPIRGNGKNSGLLLDILHNQRWVVLRGCNIIHGTATLLRT